MRVETTPSFLKDVMKINEVMSAKKGIILNTERYGNIAFICVTHRSVFIQARCKSRRVARAVELREERKVLFWELLITNPALWVFLVLPSLLSTKACNNTALTHNQKGMWKINEFVFIKWMGPWIKSFVKPQDIISIPGFCFSSFLLKRYSLSLSLSQDFFFNYS